MRRFLFVIGSLHFLFFSPLFSQVENPPSPSFIGVWQVEDTEGDAYNLCITEDGRIVSNWAKGPLGAQGERGLWRVEGTSLLAFYGNGWTDRLSPDGAAFRKDSYAPNTNLSEASTSHSLATRVQDTTATFSGVWRLNKEPDGSYLYITLQSNGRATSSIKENGAGKWEIRDHTAHIVWENGWIDEVRLEEDAYVKVAFPPNAKEPTDKVPAIKVGSSGLKTD